MAEEELFAKVENYSQAKLLYECIKNKDEELHQIFSFFCHSRHAQENLLVWDAIQEWKSDPQLDAAVAILNTYIKEGSESQVNVTYTTLQNVEGALEGPDVPEDGQLTGKEFKYVEEEVFNLMMVSLIHPFKLQFQSVYKDYQNKDKAPADNKHKYGSAFLNDGGLAAQEPDAPAAAQHPHEHPGILSRIFSALFFWR